MAPLLCGSEPAVSLPEGRGRGALGSLWTAAIPRTWRLLASCSSCEGGLRQGLAWCLVSSSSVERAVLYGSPCGLAGSSSRSHACTPARMPSTSWRCVASTSSRRQCAAASACSTCAEGETRAATLSKARPTTAGRPVAVGPNESLARCVAQPHLGPRDAGLRGHLHGGAQLVGVGRRHGPAEPRDGVRLLDHRHLLAALQTRQRQSGTPSRSSRQPLDWCRVCLAAERLAAWHARAWCPLH